MVASTGFIAASRRGTGHHFGAAPFLDERLLGLGSTGWPKYGVRSGSLLGGRCRRMTRVRHAMPHFAAEGDR